MLFLMKNYGLKVSNEDQETIDRWEAEEREGARKVAEAEAEKVARSQVSPICQCAVHLC